jgi:hypothetical protein
VFIEEGSIEVCLLLTSNGKTSASLCDPQIIFGCGFTIYNFTHTMATTLGKRKRRQVGVTKEDQREHSGDSGALEIDAQELFRRHFEAKFKPLPAVKKVEKVVEETENDSEDESDWDGISEDEEGAVEVVEHTDAHARMALMSKEEVKAFMV